MKILHLADTHFDPFYKPGSNAECGEKYFCCREESGTLQVLWEGKTVRPTIISC